MNKLWVFVAISAVSCATETEPTVVPEPEGPAVQFEEVSLSGVGTVLGVTGQGAHVVWLGESGAVGVAGGTALPWPVPAASVGDSSAPDLAAVIHTDGALTLFDSAAFTATAVALDGARVRTAFVTDLQRDGTLEVLATLEDSDAVRAYDSAGTLLWEQRWGGDVDHVVSIQGHAPRVAHTDGIGLVVRTPEGEVVSRNRPANAGGIRDLAVVTDVGSHTGASLALYHQKHGATERVDLFTPDGSTNLGAMLPDDLIGSRAGLALDTGHVLTARANGESSVTVRVLHEGETVFSHVLPHRSSWVQTAGSDGTVWLAAKDTVRRYQLTQP